MSVTWCKSVQEFMWVWGKWEYFFGLKNMLIEEA
jgi:hypothetical protein